MKMPSPAEITKRATVELAQIEERLSGLLIRVDARYLFAADSLGRLYGEMEGSSSKYFRPAPVAIELNAWLLYPFFDCGVDRDPELIQQCMDVLEEYQKAFSMAEMFSGESVGLDAQGNDSLTTHLRLHAANVRGSAYAIQVERRIKDVLGPFEARFRAKHGIGPVRAAEIAKAILFQMEENLSSGKQELFEMMSRGVELYHGGPERRSEFDALGEHFQWTIEGIGDRWVPTFDQVGKQLGDLQAEEWNALAGCLGLTSTIRPTLADPIEVQDRPLYFVRSDEAFTGQGTAVLDAIFQFFDQDARRSSELVNVYGQHVADWMEKEIGRLLKRIFPPECVIENACYPNPDQEGREAETDAVVLWGPILIVVEAKGKKIHSEGFRGDKRQLKNTISANIQEAFIQADRVIRAVQMESPIVFREKHTSRKLSVNHANLRRVMPISVTLQHLMGIPTRLAITQKLGLFKGGAYPWSVSIDDLEVITRFSDSPDIFLHYIERRIAHQSCDFELNADELDLFAHYLDNRLHPSYYQERPEMFLHDGPKAIGINGGEERFDPFYSAEWYGTPTPGNIPRLDVPPEVARVLRELRSRKDDGARFIAFSLLGFTNSMLVRINRNLDMLRNAPRPTRQIHRTTFVENNVVVNILAHATLGEVEFFQNVTVRSRIEHYKARAAATVTIGIDLREERAFQTAQWLEGEWEFEAEMEKILEEDRHSDRSVMLLPGAPKLGRNSPCPCGSGKKFKKCCWEQLGSGSHIKKLLNDDLHRHQH